MGDLCIAMDSNDRLRLLLQQINISIDTKDGARLIELLQLIPFDDLEYNDYRTLTSYIVSKVARSTDIIPYDPSEYIDSILQMDDENNKEVTMEVEPVTGFLENHRDGRRIRVYKSLLRTALSYFNEQSRYQNRLQCLFVPWFLTFNDLEDRPEAADEIASIIFQTLTEYKFQDWILYLAKFEEDPVILDATGRVQRVFGIQNYYIYDDIIGIYNSTYSFAGDMDDPEVEKGPVGKFVQIMQGFTKPYVPKPDYVKDWGLGTRNAKELQRMLRNRPSEDALRDYLARPKKVGDPNDVATIVDMYTILVGRGSVNASETDGLIREMLVEAPGESQLVAAILEDPIYRRIAGPANPGVDIDPHDSGICSRLGHPMFFCNEFERGKNEYIDAEYYDDEHGFYDYEDGNTDWFTGVCKTCKRRIEHYTHAVRRPVIGGGFMGTYCSAECIDKKLPPGDITIGALLDTVVVTLWEVGVQERD